MANYRVSTNTNNSNNTGKKQTTRITTKETTKQRKIDHLRLFTLKYDLLKISVDLQTASAAETQLAEGQGLKEQMNVLKLRMFRVGTRMPTVSGTGGQYLVPPKTFLKNNASK
jgi:hypothetical protein